MGGMFKPLFLVLPTLAVWPAWHSCRGQTTTAQESGQQPHQVSALQKSVATSANTNPSSQQTTTPTPSTTSSSDSLVTTIDAGEMDDDIDHAPRRMSRW